MSIIFARKQKAFTLIEVLIVIGIIGILAGIVIVSFAGAQEKARVAKARVDIKQIHSAIILLQADTNLWPGHKNPNEIESGAGGNEICPDGCTYKLSDCWSGIICNPNPPNNYLGWDGSYMPEIPLDPWDNEYFFDTDYDIDPGSGEIWAAVIGSYGPNGVGNNQYDEDDVIYVLRSE
jgi:prepilin-type N-terminal cleavage/methylation domain-containing protein